MRSRVAILQILIHSICASVLNAGVLYIPGDHATIATAYDSAAAGDTLILLQEGPYLLQNSLKIDKDITLVGEESLTNKPVIKYNGPSSTWFFDCIESPTIRIKNIELDGNGLAEGAAYQAKYAFHLDNGDTTATMNLFVDECVFHDFTDKFIKAYGLCGMDSLIVSRSRFYNGAKEGISLYSGSSSDPPAYVEYAEITKSVFYNISREAIKGATNPNTKVLIDQCTLFDVGTESNKSMIYFRQMSEVQVQNCIFQNNQNMDAGEEFADFESSQSVFRNNVVWDVFNLDVGLATTLDTLRTDPMMSDVDNADFRLVANSPCIDAGNPDSDGDGISWETDPDDQDPDGTRKDIGALYFDQLSDGSSGANLFFSEMIEGSANNKAIEIFNGASMTVSLADYRISWCSNGCAGGKWEYWYEFPAYSIQPGDVWVMTTDAAVTELINVANEILAYPSPAHTNGDDVIGLYHINGSDSILLDVYGEYSELDPGNGWAVAGVMDATRDHTLIRKISVEKGNTDWASSAGTNPDDSEWIVMPQNYFGDIGMHGGSSSLTFQVDMSNETVSEMGVHVAGSHNGWSTTASQMQDEDGDGVFTFTWYHSYAIGDSVQYKFINGVSWEYTEFSLERDRNYTIESLNDTIPAVCFDRLLPCDELPSITFQVDMSNETVSDSGVHVAGSFNEWQPGATELTDPDGDGIYTYTILNENYGLSTDDIIEYKFINNNSWDCCFETLESNRLDTVSGGIDTLPPVCFNSWVPCSEISMQRAWHVTTNGDDAFGDGSLANPLASIQAGIEAAADGDTILIHSGTYIENINFNGKDIILGSLYLQTSDTSQISTTIIDGNQSGTVVTINSGETGLAQLVGLTISNGFGGIDWPNYLPGGLLIDNGSSPTLSNLIISENSAIRGAGIRCTNGSNPTILQSVISDNTGGGISIYTNCSLEITNSMISNNVGGFSSGIHINDASNILMINSTIVNNDIFSQGNSEYKAINTIYDQVTLSEDGGGLVESYYSISEDNLAGSDNVESPVSLSETYRLRDNSAAIGSGIDSIHINGRWIHAPATDLDGNMRPNPTGSMPDMGAYESPLGKPIPLHLVELVFPAQNEMNISRDVDISVTFTAEMDPESIDLNTFKVYGSLSGLQAGSLSYTSSTKTVIFNPDEEFLAGEKVRVILTNGIQDTNHNRILPFQWEFTTEAVGGTALFSMESKPLTNHDVIAMESTDMNSDNLVDIIAGLEGIDSISVFTNQGGLDFNYHASCYPEAPPTSIVPGDFNGDGHMDLASTSQNNFNSVIIFANDGDGTMYMLSEIGLGNARNILPGDFDNDGDIDFIIDIENEQSLWTYVNHGDGIFSLGNQYSFEESASAIALVDIDNDGNLDLIHAFDNPYRLFVAKNNGAGDFSGNGEFELGGSISEVSSCDINGDGNIDLLIPIDSSLTILLNEGNFEFSAELLLIGEDLIHSCAISDLDGDGDTDIILKYHKQSKFSYHLNDGFGNFDFSKTISTDSWGDPSQILTVDIENDGDMDLLINTGSSVLIAVNGQSNSLPVVESISEYITEQSGDISVEFVLADNESDALDIWLEYSENAGDNWSRATISGDEGDLGPDKYTGSITWHSAEDLPGMDIYSARLRLHAHDGHAGGYAAESNVFHLDNNLPPQITDISMPDSIVVVAELTYNLADSERDTLKLGVEYSTDFGATWNSINIAQSVNVIPPGGYVETLDWYTFMSVGFQRIHDAWIRFSVSDNDPGSDTTIQNITILNYPAEYTGDLEINADDLAIFASAWNSEPQDTLYEIGPALGVVPDLSPDPDGVLDFEDLAVFVQMWNWSHLNHGLSKPISLAKVTTTQPEWLDIDVKSPTDIWASDRLTRVKFETQSNDILQVELIAETSHEVLVSFLEGNYFNDRYKASPAFRRDNRDSTLSSFCVSGLGSLKSQVEGGTMAALKISNVSVTTEYVNLLYRVWNTEGSLVESGQIKLGVESNLPKVYSLEQNYPNPFNPSTTIRYTLPEATDVQVLIYNIRGELVRTLTSELQPAGYYEVHWAGEGIDGEIVSAGLYLCRIQTAAFTETIKMVFLK